MMTPRENGTRANSSGDQPRSPEGVRPVLSGRKEPALSLPVFSRVLDPASVRVELVKWIGLGVMLADHVGAFVLQPSIATELLGSLAFPLFAIALAAALAQADARAQARTFQRCMTFGLIAEAGRLLVESQMLPLNVLFTLGLGVALAQQAVAGFPILRTVAIFMAAVTVEFSIPGVVLVALLVMAYRDPRVWHLFALVIAFGLLHPFNPMAPHAAFLAIPLVACLSFVPAHNDVPRVPQLFYWLYCLQFPVLWVAASLFAAK